MYFYDDELIVIQTTPRGDGTATALTTDNNFAPYGTIQVDQKKLTTATLTAHVPGLECSYNLVNPEGLYDCSDTVIDVQVTWTPIGKIVRSSSTFITRPTPGTSIRTYVDEISREAPAHGSINGTVWTESQVPLTCDGGEGTPTCGHISVHTIKTITK